MNKRNDNKLTSDGYSAGYYDLTVHNKAGEKIDCQASDIIRDTLCNDYDLGNIYKAMRRIAASRLGIGKAGIDEAYDLKKIQFHLDQLSSQQTNRGVR